MGRFVPKQVRTAHGSRDALVDILVDKLADKLVDKLSNGAFKVNDVDVDNTTLARLGHLKIPHTSPLSTFPRPTLPISRPFSAAVAARGALRGRSPWSRPAVAIRAQEDDDAGKD